MKSGRKFPVFAVAGSIGAIAASVVALGAIAVESIPILAVAGAIALLSGVAALSSANPSQQTAGSKITQEQNHFAGV